MATPNFCFRCPADLLAAIDRTARASRIERGEFVRLALGRALGVAAGPLPEGFAALTPEAAAEIRSMGGKARGKALRAAKNPKKSARRKSNSK